MADKDVPTKVIGHSVRRPREQVEEEIRNAILKGELTSGEMLPPESELARQFGVSRTTLREALRVLSSEHLIRKVPGARGGNFVEVVDYRFLGRSLMDSMSNLMALGRLDFEEVADVRQFLEVPSVRMAACMRQENDLAELKSILERQRSASVDDPEVPDLDRRFHIAIARSSRNRVLASLVSALHHAAEPVSYLELSADVGRETVRQHGRIFRAIEVQDPDDAENAIVEHLTYLKDHIIQHRDR